MGSVGDVIELFTQFITDLLGIAGGSLDSIIPELDPVE